MNIHNKPCPCHSGKKYKKCCRALHLGQRLATTPEDLLRSRYSAYALGLADYIITTTHPINSDHLKTELVWRAELELFARHTTFDALEVIARGEYEASEFAGPRSEQEAWVRFRAGLTQREHDASFEERSRFVKEDGAWAYALTEHLVESEDAASNTSEIQTP